MGKKRKIEYAICDGMVVIKKYKGKEYELIIKEKVDTFRYHIKDKIFRSSTAAAMYVTKSKTSISGPFFWGFPIKDIVS